MTAKRRGKFSRARGNKSHGWGAKKKHRGTGNLGGKGYSGLGKRTQSRKPSYWANSEYMGSSGFKARGVPDKIISLRDLDKRDAGIINLSSEGYGKLLGSGDVTKKFDVVVAKFTAKAEQRIKEKGGSVKAE